jgi:hypothetical protein
LLPAVLHTITSLLDGHVYLLENRADATGNINVNLDDGNVAESGRYRDDDYAGSCAGAVRCDTMILLVKCLPNKGNCV